MSDPAPDRSLAPALEALAERDPDIARCYTLCGLPPERTLPGGFDGLMRIIVAQQVSTASAQAIRDRLDAALGTLTPERFLACGDDTLKTVGLSRQKMRYGRALAEALTMGSLNLDGIPALADTDAIAHLTQVPGIGLWSAEIYLMFALGRTDIWPAGDLALREAMGRVKGLEAAPAEKEARTLAKAWRPHRSAAARFMWHVYRHPAIPN